MYIQVYISKNLQYIVNGFIRAGICGALDGNTSEDGLIEEHSEQWTDEESEEESDDEVNSD